MFLHLPHQNMSATLIWTSSCQGIASPPLPMAPSADRFFLLPVIWVTALNRKPNETANAARMPKMACSTGIPSGQ